MNSLGFRVSGKCFKRLESETYHPASLAAGYQRGRRAGQPD